MKLEERGRPSMEQVESVKQKIIGLIEEMRVVHPERLRKAYIARYRQDNPISWHTIRKYLDQLKDEGKIREEVITKGKRRTISLVRANF